MIYESVASEEPIRQGDIFRSIPNLELSLSRLAILQDNDPEITTWNDVVENGDIVTAIVAVEPVYGIVITQNCDAVRGKHICLARIDCFLDVVNKREHPPKTADKWQSLLTEHMKVNLRHFYLPECKSFGFAERMAADFRVLLRVPREDLEQLRHLRMGRLNSIAYEHFRESLAQFFRRYPYNEWYPLTKEEADAYVRRRNEPIELYDWQK